jgi:threonylcarbamoyladenosine tRNA methylthiotransferase MtaB
MKRMDQFVIKTLGCKVNQSESETLAAAFRRLGLSEFTSDTAPAASGSDSSRVGVCIINTCTVTERASMQCRQAIRQAIRTYPRAKIIVTGCYAQTQPEEILGIEGVSRVIPQLEKQEVLAAVITELDVTDTGVSDTALPASSETQPAPYPWPDAGAFSPDETQGRRTRAVLKVQDGCNARCTYCIVPRARGKSRSMPEDGVISNLHGLNRAGYREVVLSGIHLGSYGLDFSPPSSLLALLETIDTLGIIPRVRLSSIEPGELSDDIIDLVACSEIFCRHFHIPLQSGDDGVLRRMGRHYSGRFFGDLIWKVHSKIPDAAIGVDVLAGFPGESDAAFENTFELIASLPVAYLHVFPFSPRKTTPAHDMPHKLPAHVIKGRAARMRALGENKRLEFHDALVRRKLSVLVESTVDAATGHFRGRTSNYVPVHLRNYAGEKNSFVTVIIEKSLGKAGVLASPISSSAGT